MNKKNNNTLIYCNFHNEQVKKIVEKFKEENFVKTNTKSIICMVLQYELQKEQIKKLKNDIKTLEIRNRFNFNL